MFRKLATLLGTLGIVAIGVVGIALLGKMRPDIERKEPEISAPAVFYQVATPQSVTLDVAAQGEVRPRTDINLTAQVAGRVMSIADAFVNGGAFQEGDTLLQIEDADYRAAAAAAKARMAQAEESLRREEAEGALAARDYAELGRDDDPSALALREPQLAQARANYEATKAEYEAARLNLARTRVQAPFEGRVRERIAGVGQYVAPGAQLGRIFSTDVAEIRLALTDNDLAKLDLPIAFTASDDNPGPPVTLSAFVAGEMHEWEARILRTDGAIDPGTRQISAIAVVEDPYGDGAAADGTPLAIGLFVDAIIRGNALENAIVLPRSALHGRDMVYVVNEDDVLERRQVRVVSSAKDTITLAAGVAPGERVVTSPLRGADDGDEVIPTDPTAPMNNGGEDLTANAASASANAGDRQ